MREASAVWSALGINKLTIKTKQIRNKGGFVFHFSDAKPQHRFWLSGCVENDRRRRRLVCGLFSRLIGLVRSNVSSGRKSKTSDLTGGARRAGGRLLRPACVLRLILEELFGRLFTINRDIRASHRAAKVSLCSGFESLIICLMFSSFC